MKRHLSSIATIAFAFALALGWFGLASAHAKVVSSDPKDGATLAQPPSKITIVFSEEIDANQSSFTVTNGNGATVGSGKLDNTDLDHKTMTGTLDSGAGDGNYTINWVAVTPDDNGKEEGTISFTVGSAPAQATAAATAAATSAPAATARPAATTRPAATSAPAATTTPTNLPKTAGGPDSSIYVLLVAVLLVAVGAFALRRAR